MEGLSRSIKHAKEVGKVKGLKLSENGQALTHQQFVDDTMLQGIPTVKESLAYKQILSDFSMATGMEVNLSKSKIFFFNTNIVIQRNISRILGFQRDVLPSKYLGVPLTAKPLLKSIWEPMINKMRDKIRKWTIRSLKLAGREGDLALFWEDKWQQEPTLLKEDFLDLKKDTDTKGLSKVKDFWDQTNSARKWRTWRNIDYRDDNPLKAKAEAFMKMLEQRKILVTGGHDQLRWGNNNEGTFNLKETKHILLELDSLAPDRIWKNLWRHQGWMKIKLFMWLVHHKKILTWDNIQKRGVLGPSRC
eukprot:PITA_19460